MPKIGIINQPELYDKLLKCGDYDIVFNCNGAAARENLKRHAVDVVITDLIMEGEDGFALLEEYKNVKFIVVSDLKSEVFKIKALELGAQYYLTKPDEIDRLEECISQVVDGSSDAQENSKSRKTLDERNQEILSKVVGK